MAPVAPPIKSKTAETAKPIPELGNNSPKIYRLEGNLDEVKVELFSTDVMLKNIERNIKKWTGNCDSLPIIQTDDSNNADADTTAKTQGSIDVKPTKASNKEESICNSIKLFPKFVVNYGNNQEQLSSATCLENGSIEITCSSTKGEGCTFMCQVDELQKYDQLSFKLREFHLQFSTDEFSSKNQSDFTINLYYYTDQKISVPVFINKTDKKGFINLAINTAHIKTVKNGKLFFDIEVVKDGFTMTLSDICLGNKPPKKSWQKQIGDFFSKFKKR
ncbi:MAG: hypothetical protein JW841_08625 [Deltaproteobacteria bacterium]|nr:hypothetical protein [Deltaproteobacteria bacterium]